MEEDILCSEMRKGCDGYRYEFRIGKEGKELGGWRGVVG